MAQQEPWIELQNGKQLSRLLYTNPVCFLCTQQEEGDELSHDGVPRNVMVLSWLSATNNEGRFVFSINQRRHTSFLLRRNSDFVLSVPVKGMEDLVRNVGSVSGAWGVSKFPEDLAMMIQPFTDDSVTNGIAKRRKGPRFPQGIPGLRAVPLGNRPDFYHHRFGIRGTVAQLDCTIYNVMEDVIDSEHLLVLAQVQRAFVHPNYWDGDKNLFRPQTGLPPYLTFFGSQTFGYVTSDPVSSVCNESPEEGS